MTIKLGERAEGRGVIWVEVGVELRKASGELLWEDVREKLCH